MGSKVLKQRLQEMEAVLRQKDKQIKEMQVSLKSKEEQITQLKRSEEVGRSGPENLGDSVAVRPEKQEARTTDHRQSRREIPPNAEELKAVLSAMSEKQLEIERLHQKMENQEREFRIKLEEKEVEISSLLNKNHGLIGDLEKSLKDREDELQQRHAEERSIRKQMHARAEKLQTAHLAMTQKQREIDRLSKIIKYQEQEFRSKMDEKQLEIERLSNWNDSRMSDLEQKVTELKGQNERLQARDDQLKAAVVAAGEKQQEIESLRQIMATREQEFRIKLDAKNLEIGDVRRTLAAVEKKLLAMNTRSFWQYLRARFQTD